MRAADRAKVRWGRRHLRVYLWTAKGDLVPQPEGVSRALLPAARLPVSLSGRAGPPVGPAAGTLALPSASVARRSAAKAMARRVGGAAALVSCPKPGEGPFFVSFASCGYAVLDFETDTLSAAEARLRSVCCDLDWDAVTRPLGMR